MSENYSVKEIELTPNPRAVKFILDKPVLDSLEDYLEKAADQFISKTEDNRPPYLAGKPPLVSVTFFIASALKTEKIPNT